MFSVLLQSMLTFASEHQVNSGNIMLHSVHLRPKMWAGSPSLQPLCYSDFLIYLNLPLRFSQNPIKDFSKPLSHPGVPKSVCKSFVSQRLNNKAEIPSDATFFPTCWIFLSIKAVLFFDSLTHVCRTVTPPAAPSAFLTGRSGRTQSPPQLHFLFDVLISIKPAAARHLSPAQLLPSNRTFCRDFLGNCLGNILFLSISWLL